MNKTELLNNLFVKWEHEHRNESDESFHLTSNGLNIKKEFFEKDGIIDETVFEKQDRKVLFISSEANVDEHGKPGDLRQDYLGYYSAKDGRDSWQGKMRERITALYQLLAGKIDFSPLNKLANEFAALDLNKRGGRAKIDGGMHIVYYCENEKYKSFILEEISIIDPDIIVWVGTNTFDMGIPEILGAKSNGNKKYLCLNGKSIPILRVWQTSYYQGRNKPLEGYDNKIIGKQCAKLKEEMEKYGLL